MTKRQWDRDPIIAVAITIAMALVIFAITEATR